MGIGKVISSTNSNLPEDAAHAPYHSITLPKTFELDSFNFEDDLDNLNRIEDTNLKSYEEITLEDEIPAREDQYVAILIDEDVEKIPEMEFMLDAVHDHHSENDPLWNDVMDPDDDMEELTMTDKETESLVVEEMMEHDEPPSAISAEVQEFTNPQISFGHQSPDHLVLQSTPPPEEPKPMRRRRKLLIDAEIVLPEDESDPQLGDTSTLKRRRKNVLLSFLNRSKLNKRRRKDGMSFGPLLTGLCEGLRNIYKEDFVSTKLKMASSQEEEEEDHAEPSDNYYSPPPGNDTDLLSEISPSPQFISSPPMSTDDFTPSTCCREGLDVEDTVLSDIHDFDSSVEDLSFLDQDDRTPIGEQVGTTEFDTLPARTRTVAQFLQGKSPETPISEDLNLNTILEGKNKKMCARMFYETLVLKNCGLVNVNQNVPYGDITLKVTSRLKEQLST
ncbi:hypothetical protein R3W88_007113 [Solanum pinnatisectum]|uniref:Rad21/Rec8-like protein C-terminal eukaryotic domain-containing protein n=1 Tax=Solanum pinnatisectum TaxID=50273 RepID=A0AAV9KGM7_9SOLN|nr:hypothetical protein R3W88_007113 [Solanum pinnatisectum]